MYLNNAMTACLHSAQKVLAECPGTSPTAKIQSSVSGRIERSKYAVAQHSGIDFENEDDLDGGKVARIFACSV